MTQLLAFARPTVIAALGAGALVALDMSLPVSEREDAPVRYVGTLQAADGKPVNGQHAIALELWDDANEGALVCALDAKAISVSAGHFTLELSDDCISSMQHGTTLWTDIQVDGERLTPRAALAVPSGDVKPPAPSRAPDSVIQPLPAAEPAPSIPAPADDRPAADREARPSA